jgi:hypothetical protein
VDYVSNPHTIN